MILDCTSDPVFNMFFANLFLLFLFILSVASTATEDCNARIKKDFKLCGIKCNESWDPRIVDDSIDGEYKDPRMTCVMIRVSLVTKHGIK